ncbi:hypothetical protein HGRIS_004496 [Hohenbuehelia grisea]|uniref:Formin GTPase-binding domain-containing protein n=1 Tax=Hohenbuehelia grisea TaxID=104357 RepID=A0ABR3JCV8_9AGAR
MFKGILPSHKRISSSDFTMLTSLGDTAPNGKENHPAFPLAPSTNHLMNAKERSSLAQAKPLRKLETQKKKRQDSSRAKEEQNPLETDEAFVKLLDDLQIPASVRTKMIGVDATVKAAMLKSSQAMLVKLPASPPETPRTLALRKARSTESIGSPMHAGALENEDLPMPPRAPFTFDELPSSGRSSPRLPSTHARGSSFDLSRNFSRSQVHLPMSTSVVDLVTGARLSKDKSATGPSKGISATKFFSILSGTSSLQLDVEMIKKLRLLLRNESASWTHEFLGLGGYSALLTRLNELLEVEWREEQHDDQVLHELLRCVKALTTSSIGCVALRSSCPTPFAQLISLLYSDKKPGDVATRQLIVDLLLLLFDLYPPSALPCSSNRSRREIWDQSISSLQPSNLITLPAPHRSLFSLIRSLLLTPAPPPSENPSTPISPHEFIENLHRPRIYKSYLQELSDVCRDYFWVFCHPKNTFWVLNEVHEGRVEQPRAPGGMTGGVEFEAMGYFTTHLRLVNAISKAAAELSMPKDHELSAYRLHSDLFLSGIERILLIARKASTTYYPTLHLEIARYIAWVGRAGYELPWTVSRLIESPPAEVSRNPAQVKSSPATQARGSGRNTPGTPSKRGGALDSPMLPSPKRFEPMKMS